MICQRCGGYAYREKDNYGSWTECLICGWVREDGAPPPQYDKHVEKVSRMMDFHFRKTPPKGWKR